MARHCRRSARQPCRSGAAGGLCRTDAGAAQPGRCASSSSSTKSTAMTSRCRARLRRFRAGRVDQPVRIRVTGPGYGRHLCRRSRLHEREQRQFRPPHGRAAQRADRADHRARFGRRGAAAGSAGRGDKRDRIARRCCSRNPIARADVSRRSDAVARASRSKPVRVTFGAGRAGSAGATDGRAQFVTRRRVHGAIRSCLAIVRCPASAVGRIA